MPIVVYLLINTGFEDCQHHGIFKNADLAKACAQQLDDEAEIMPHWKIAHDTGEVVASTHGPLEWRSDWASEVEIFYAQAIGFNRHWTIVPYEVVTE